MNLLPGILVATTIIGGGSLSNLCPPNIGDLQNKLNSNRNGITTQVINVNPSDLESVLGGLGVDMESIRDYLPSSRPSVDCPPDEPSYQAPNSATPGTGTTKPETTTPSTGTTKPETTQPEKDTNNSGSKEEAEKSYVEQVVDLVNAERANVGLSALTMTDELNEAALVRAKESTKAFSHTRPNGTSFWTVLKENGISYRGAGENIAWGQSTPEEVVDAWMNSEGHRANILNKKFTSIGVGYHLNGKTPYWSQLFTY